MVGRPDVKSQQSADLSQTSQNPSGVRCLKTGLGEAYCLERIGALLIKPTRPVGSQQCFRDSSSFAILTFLKTRRDVHVLIYQDSHMGGTVSICMSTSSRTVGMVFNSENYSIPNTYQTVSTPELITQHGGTPKNPAQMFKHFPQPSRGVTPFSISGLLVIQNHLILAT